jgi:Methyltransferase FkbM domain
MFQSFLIFSKKTFAADTEDKCNQFIRNEFSLSQWNQDLYLKSLAADDTTVSSPPYFVEIGSFHPFFYSNSALLEHCLGARGVCVEPNPSMHRLFETERPNCLLVPTCVYSETKTLSWSFDVDPIEAKVADKTSPYSQTIQVPCLSFYDLLSYVISAKPPSKDNEGRFVIDFLLIDAEGAEVDILHDFSSDKFSNFDIKYFLIENSPRHSELEKILFAAGYEKFALIGADWAFRKTKALKASEIFSS